MITFYKEHFECFIGDKGIRTANPQALEELRDRYRTRKLVVLSGYENNQPVQLSLNL